jgi:uncharacterized protein (TIGR03435 family)
MGRTATTLFLVGSLLQGVVAQQAPQAFAAASIKPSNPKDDAGALNRFGPGGNYSMHNGYMRQILMDAYGLPADRILGAPEWFNTERYDIVARGDGTANARADLMLRTLLRDRFGLVGNVEMRDRPVYALRVIRPDGGLGPRIALAEYNCDDPEVRKTASTIRRANDLPACGVRNLADRVLAGGTSLKTLAAFIAYPAGRVVVDKTGLSGPYDFTLEWANEPAPGDDRVSLFTAIQEQLGLRLVPDRASLDVLVIKAIHKPTPN